MAQESICKVAIVGGGACGCTCALFLQDFCDVTVFEPTFPLRTLLATGGGRCNFAHSIYDIKELAENYPRGEKFLYSVFSKFSTAETLKLFEDLGIEYYLQDDGRFFPTSNSAKDVRNAFLQKIKNVKIKKEKVLRVNSCKNLSVVTDCGSYDFDKVVIATGGHSGYNIAKYLGLAVVSPVPSLVALKTKEDVSPLAGVVLRNISAKFLNDCLVGDLLFTHRGVSGPLVYKISSIMAREKYPYEITFKCVNLEDFQDKLNLNSHKNILNLLSDFVPKSFGDYILQRLNIDRDLKCHKINGKLRDEIIKSVEEFSVIALAPEKGEEVVTCGGVDLKEINPKTLESKKVPNLYFGGEVLDIDGFCGGFNLQNCWSNAYIIAEAIKSSI